MKNLIGPIPAKRISIAVAALALMFCLTACEEEKPSTELTINANRDANGDLNASADINVSSGQSSVSGSASASGRDTVSITIPLTDRLTVTGVITNSEWEGDLVLTCPHPDGDDLTIGANGDLGASVSITLNWP